MNRLLFLSPFYEFGSDRIIKTFEDGFKKYFKIVRTLPINGIEICEKQPPNWTNHLYSEYLHKHSVKWELAQIEELLNLSIQSDDYLFVYDMCYPEIIGAFLSRLNCKKFGYFNGEKTDFLSLNNNIGMREYDILLSINRQICAIDVLNGVFISNRFLYSEYCSNNGNHKKMKIVHFPNITDCVFSKSNNNFYDVFLMDKLDYLYKETGRKELCNVVCKELADEYGFNTTIFSEECLDIKRYFNDLMLTKIVVFPWYSSERVDWVSLQDSINCGCIPLIPNFGSYEELLPEEYRYKNLYDLRGKILNILDKKINICSPKELLIENETNNFFENVCSEMLKN